jgi:hypothetical protein
LTIEFFSPSTDIAAQNKYEPRFHRAAFNFATKAAAANAAFPPEPPCALSVQARRKPALHDNITLFARCHLSPSPRAPAVLGLIGVLGAALGFSHHI